MIKFVKRWGYAPNGNNVESFNVGDESGDIPEPWETSAVKNGFAVAVKAKPAHRNKAKTPPKNKAG